MTYPPATITGRIVGPDGLGRMGRVTFRPTTPTAQPQAVLVGQASFRIDPDGYLVGQVGRSATVLPGDYEIDLNIPGDSGAHIRRRVTISSGQALTLADLLTTDPPPPPPPPPPSPGPVPKPQPQPGPIPQPSEDGIRTAGGSEVRHSGSPGVLEAANPAEVVDLGGGVLTWRRLDDGMIRPDGRAVRDTGTPGILEAMDKASVIDRGNGTLSWR